MRHAILSIFLLTCLLPCLAKSQETNRFKIWLNGYHYRLALQGKPTPMKFTAVDGRKVDLSQMHGEVVLVDFWETECEPCVEELPRMKAAFEKYHRKGFEIIGISDDTDKNKLERFLKGKEITWPQYFDGKEGLQNKFFAEFGINAMPHMFLVDKKGCLRFDDVVAFGASTNFESKIENLLMEKND